MHTEVEIDFKDFHKAFSDGKISFEQLIEVLVDNFGAKNTKIFLKKNLKRCFKYDEKRYLELKDHLESMLEYVKNKKNI